MTLIRSRPSEPGQHLAIHQRTRRATCEEADCALLREGALLAQPAPKLAARNSKDCLSYDTVRDIAYFEHPKGAECGPRCPKEYCPCSPPGPGSRGLGGYPHRIVDDRFDVAFTEATHRPMNPRKPWLHDTLPAPTPANLARGVVRRVGMSEAFDRLGEGVYALQFAEERGI